MKYFHNMQDFTSDCGVAIIKSLLQHYNRYSESVFEATLSNRNINQGLSLFDIEDILSQFGIKGSSYEVDNFDLLTYECPTILVIDRNGENHYVLSYGLIEDKVIVSDPLSTSINKVKINDLKDIFKGYVFLVENLEELNTQSKNSKIKNGFNRNRELKFEMFYLTILLWLIPISMIFSIQYFLIYQLRNLLVWQVWLIVLFEFLLVGIYLKSKVDYAELLSNEISSNQEILTFSFLAEIDNLDGREENIYNRLIKFWNNFNAADWELKRFLVNVEIFCISLLCVITFVFSKEATLISTIFLLCFAYIFKLRVKIRKNYNKIFFNSIGELSLFVEEAIHNKLDRHVFSSSQEVKEYLKNVLTEIKNNDMVQRKSKVWILGIYDIFMYLNLFFIFVYIMVMYYYEIEFKISNVFVSFIIIYLMYSLGKPVVEKLLDLEKYSALSMGKHTDLSNPRMISDDINISKISIKDVSVRYDEDSQKSILNGLTLDIVSPSLTLIKGNNGTGKTTLLQLIIGELLASKGDISYFDINDQQIDCSIEVLQSRISCYFSSQFLNYASIYRNICYDIYANSGNDIDNLFGLDLNKVVFYNGVNLSQGERQKVLLSRAFNKEANIYIFDEPISNLDTYSKNIVVKRILELKEKSMVFVVSHDSYFDSFSDNIIHLKE
ncbi:ATP-binding cassette domain-containing protein [Streptococcus sciuri]|uniref:ATP-binding cassette domain-containing protein n=1 Tax=Streptococcus sciuri TaxID=2973939 RepID=A0ABT2F6N7_9STRE|nr:ATP-binding cassette domain-containing protein [Streptococcus sciuri]MCS4487500.1 ATP-binding cassette domain-containing protein [Streptococcus sciuri]